MTLIDRRYQLGIVSPELERGEALFAAVSFEGAEEGGEDAGAAGADRVAQSGGAAVDVDLGVGDAEVVHGDHADAGEGLVDLVEVDVGRLPAGQSSAFCMAPTGAVVNLATGIWGQARN